MPFKKKGRENGKTRTKLRVTSRKQNFRNKRRTKSCDGTWKIGVGNGRVVNNEASSQSRQSFPEIINAVIESNQSSTSRYCIPQVMDECHRNDMD